MSQYFMLIMLMIRRKRLDDLVMIQQLQGVPRIFRQDQVDLFQHLKCPEADVLQIADGRRNEVEHIGECGEYGSVEVWNRSK